MDEYFIKHSFDLAEKSIELGGGPFGAVIVDEYNNVIGQGHNRVTLDNDPTLHAEMVAIKNACQNRSSFNLSGCKLYTSCEPCPMCLSAIYWARINTVYYGNTREDAAVIGFDDSFIYDEIKKPIEERKIVMKQLCSTHAKKSFHDWINYDEKVKY